MDPLLLYNVVAGFDKDKSYLASIDLYGTYLENDYVCTGFGEYLCKPIIMNYWKPNMTENQVKDIVI